MATGEEDVLLLRVRAGEILEGGSWVYAWLQASGDRKVIYVGATGMHPATRAWLHLHNPDPEVGRILARYPAAKVDSLDVLAMRLPPEVSRVETKLALIARLSREQLLSERYVGGAPEEDVHVPSRCSEQAERLLSHIAAHIRR